MEIDFSWTENIAASPLPTFSAKFLPDAQSLGSRVVDLLDLGCCPNTLNMGSISPEHRRYIRASVLVSLDFWSGH